MSGPVTGLVHTGPVTHAEPTRPPAEDGLTVGRAAALVGVSVKTLHHWDAVGLVRPGGHTPAGYRVYSADDIARLHRVLIYRELGFPLAEIARILDDPSADARDHLRRQRAELERRAGRLREMARAVDRMLEALDAGLRLTPEEQAEIFGADWRPEWVGEARDRWGGTAQWTQYAERAAAMTPQDWKDAVARTEALHADLAAARRAGVAAGSAEAGALAERHRALLSAYFDCTHAMHACLGRMFAEDPGFAAHYDGIEPGLAGWLRDAIFANAERHGVDPATAGWE